MLHFCFLSYYRTELPLLHTLIVITNLMAKIRYSGATEHLMFSAIVSPVRTRGGRNGSVADEGTESARTWRLVLKCLKY